MLLGILRTMRPHQWVKNLVVLAPLVFALELFDAPRLLRALGAFALFCALAGAVYVLNDLVDVEADRQHEEKRHRPIASGRVSERQARVALAVLVTIALAGSLALGVPFSLAALGYLANNLAYSFKLKRIPYVDVLSITAGFELRVVAGALAADVAPSAYLLVEMFLAATFLALGKRAHELAVNVDRAAHTGEQKPTRAVLRAYDPRVLTALLYGTGLATLLVYVVYTLDPATMAALGTRWMVVSAPVAAAGLLRFVQLVRRTRHAQSPTDAMLRDPLFLGALAVWAVLVVALLYFT